MCYLLVKIALCDIEGFLTIKEAMMNNIKITAKKLYCLILGLTLVLISNLAFAATIVISGNKIIKTAVKYDHVTLDMSNGSFTLTKSGKLEISDSIINISISSANPFFASLDQGRLILKRNSVNVTASGIVQNPTSPALYRLIQVTHGTLDLEQNQFAVNQPYSIGFIITNPSFDTQGFKILENKIRNFHGGIYLYNSSHAEVDDNSFENVSFSNVLNIGSMNNYKRNIFSFPGNLSLGNAIDIINSDTAIVEDNIISSSSNYGIFIMGSQHLFIENNKLTDGLSYGIFIQTPAPIIQSKNKYLTQLLGKYKMAILPNQDISITDNYFEQNRYGLAGEVVQDLTVDNNIFIQRFNDSAARQHWTDNNVLLASASNLTWTNNSYKEAFTQDNEGDNTQALNIVPFPATGGVILP